MKKLTGFHHWEEVQICPLCSAQGFEPYLKYHSGILTLRLQSCRQCDLVVQSPCLTKKSLEKFYKAEYHSRLKKIIGTNHCENLFQRGLRRGAYICKFLDENGIEYKDSVVFEIGCAYGGILEQFQRHGCKVKGCDSSPVTVQYGISKGLDLIVGSVDEMLKLNHKAGLIILSHVLEHISEPNSFLKKIKELLNPNGILYVEVPGLKNPRVKNRQFIQPGHLLYFNLETVSEMVKKNGFNYVSGNEIVQSVFLVA